MGTDHANVCNTNSLFEAKNVEENVDVMKESNNSRSEMKN